MEIEEINKKIAELLHSRLNLINGELLSSEELQKEVEGAAKEITDKIFEQISSLPTIKSWVARNADVEGGQINLFSSKPRRKEENADHYINWVWLSSDFRGRISLPDTLFPDLRWKDEPKPVRVIIEEIKSNNP
jgi:hypothetical protein